ncbi:MAG: single-stranded-DNA-specific exonuclease RecJ [Actinobacteria bacterium]|nr:single-stranded-DNA-specific exonuclease RecJ [Actinomycetota bacterium]
MIDPGSWSIAPVRYSDVRRLAAELGVSEVMAQVLVRRGFSDAAAAQTFLHPDYLVHNPYLMAGMTDARRRLDKALQRGEPIAVHGDYDADGITATFLLVSVLEQLGADVRSHLPNRFSEGYGVSRAAVEDLAAAGVKLLVTVDCGINARAEVARARKLGLDVIVTDHHEMEGSPPDCMVVTPKLPGYPCPQLAGVGVAFKLAHALLEEPTAARVEVPLALRPLSDVVAIGTIADIVPLVDENRVLASIGLGRLRSLPRPGLAALMEVAGVKADGVNAGTVGFRLAPRLNAAGRLEDASLALELLGCADRDTALPLALRLNELNQERQAIEAGIFAAAAEMVPDPLPAALVLSSRDWHEGVVGIVASRVAERFNRPAILLSEIDDEAKGSGRSIPGFDLLGAVERSAEHLLAFGGHRAACGLRLRRQHIPAFRAAFVAQAAAMLGEADLLRTQPVDAVVGGRDLTLGLADELELLAPHGLGNRKVTLLLHAAEVVGPRLTSTHRHAQYRVRCDGATCQAIHFNFGNLQELKEPGRFDVPLSLSKNEYNGAVSAQAEVKGLYRLGAPERDVCATACDLSCPDRLTGEALWEELLEGSPWPSADAPEALAQARADGRLLDRRGGVAVSALASLAAGGERVLVLVADVARRRPLLSRDVLSPQLARRAAYLQSACVGRLGAALAGPDIVMTGYDVVAARPQLAAAFAHIVLLDPPFTRRLIATLFAAAPEAWVHVAWGRAEADFAAQVAAADLDLDTAMRRAWRALSSAAGRFDEALEQELLGGDQFLRSAGATAAALRSLRDACLLRVDGTGGYHLERPQSKVDVTQTDTFKAWHNLFQTSDFLRTCLTAGI